ncbi:MAG TPA: hydantoinase/oxoprolinase family protein [Chloroflexota bacterium]
MAPFRLGVDVGGTFTDVALLDVASGRLFRVKTPSTPRDPSRGVIDGVRRACQQAGIQPSALSDLVHGTTVATNAVLEGRGARVGLVTTRGFRDVLHVARSRTPGPLAGWISMPVPQPAAALECTIEARERMDARGAVVAELDEPNLQSELRALLAREEIETLCISLVHAYANPDHERRIRELAHEVAPDVPVTLSSDVLPELGEYERTLTATVTASVGPLVSRYLDDLQTRLHAEHVAAPVHILRSDGGVMALSEARHKAAHMLLSGPAGGVVGALGVAQQSRVPNVLTCDVGGTSTDVALCRGGAPEIARQTTVGALTIRVPSVDVRTVGAGGGSIAHVPALTRALRVGPRSAGADPGPACYGQGGTEPTVTDAHVVLGYLPPRLLGGAMSLDVDAAQRAIQRIADALGLDLLQAAAGVVNIANENMLGALRLVSVQRGFDPREFALMAFGGAGPLHANALGRLIGASPVIVPRAPGLLCAIGDVLSDHREDFSASVLRTFDVLTADALASRLDELGARAHAWLASNAIAEDAREVQYQVDVRYYRQGHALQQSVDPVTLRRDGLAGLGQRFDEQHQRLYGFSLPDGLREVVSARAVAIGHSTPPAAIRLEPAPSPDPADALIDKQHAAYFDGHLLRTPIYDRDQLLAGHVVPGPAIVAELDSTTLVEPGWQGTIDEHANMLIRPRVAP